MAAQRFWSVAIQSRKYGLVVGETRGVRRLLEPINSALHLLTFHRLFDTDWAQRFMNWLDGANHELLRVELTAEQAAKLNPEFVHIFNPELDPAEPFHIGAKVVCPEPGFQLRERHDVAPDLVGTVVGWSHLNPTDEGFLVDWRGDGQVVRMSASELRPV